MAISTIESKLGSVPAFEEFFIHVDREDIIGRRIMTAEEIAADWQRQRSLKHPWVFQIGALTRKIDPLLGRLPDLYIYTLWGIKSFCLERGLGVYDCFQREKWGASTIPAEEATALDGQAVRDCDLVITSPGFSISRNTPKEIALAARLGKPLIFLLDRKKPESYEEEFMELAKMQVSKSAATIPSTIIEFCTQVEMYQDLGTVLDDYKEKLAA